MSTCDNEAHKVSAATEDFTIGVEEEYQIVGADSRELRPRAERIMRGARDEAGDDVTNELYLSQIEIGTPVCRTLADVRGELTRLRHAVCEAARRTNSRICAAATHPFSHWEDQQVTPKARYVAISQDYQQLAREQIICGCHVHVGIDDSEMMIQTMNRARAFLAPLLALSANSPYWLGTDTGYASYRTEIWSRFPMSGAPQIFRDHREYERLVGTLVAAEAITDGSKIYWDLRPSSRFSTLEFRVTDVCLTIDEAVMIAGLVQALARTCYAEAARDAEAPEYARPELLRAAQWRAARYGLDADLIDVPALRSRPAPEVIASFLAYLRPALEEHAAWDEVTTLVSETLARGNGASRQRAAYVARDSHEGVVDFVIDETRRGLD